MLIHVTRHGQPVLGDMPAGTDTEFPPGDPALTALGRRQAEWLGRRLLQLGFHGTIYSSPYRRTLETAEVVAAIVDCGIVAEPYLQEYVQVEGVPTFDALTLEKAQALYPHVRTDTVLPCPWLASGPESFEDVVVRVTPFVDRLVKQPAGDVLLVGHGATVGASRDVLWAHSGHGTPAGHGHNWNCSLSTYEVNGPGHITCIRFSDFSHMPEAEITSNATSFHDMRAASDVKAPPTECALPVTDFHMHATAHRLGNPKPHHTVRAVIERCCELGVETAGIMEHLNASSIHPLTCLEALVAEFRSLTPPFPCYVGTEVDILDDAGSVSCGPSVRDDLGLDYMLAAVHLDPDAIPDVTAYIEEEFRRMLGVIEHNPFVDVIAHPWGEGIRWQRAGHIESWSYAMIPDACQEAFIEKAGKHGKAIELSFSGKNTLDDDAYRRFVCLVRDAGVCITVGSDAHDLQGIERAVPAARALGELGFNKQQLWDPPAVRR